MENHSNIDSVNSKDIHVIYLCYGIVNILIKLKEEYNLPFNISVNNTKNSNLCEVTIEYNQWDKLWMEGVLHRAEMEYEYNNN